MAFYYINECNYFSEQLLDQLEKFTERMDYQVSFLELFQDL